LLPGSSIRRHPRVGLDPLLQLLPGAEGDHGAGGDRDFLAGLGVAAGALVLAPQVEVAEAGQLDLAALLQRFAEHVEERVHEFLRLALVQADVLVQTLGHFRLGQRHSAFPWWHRRGNPRRHAHALILAPCSRWRLSVTAATTASTSLSVNVRDSSCRIKPIAKLLNPDSTPLPVYTSNRRRSRRNGPAAALALAATAAQDAASGTTKARSRRTEGKRDSAAARGSGRASSGSRSSSKATTSTSRSSAFCRRGCNWPIQPILVPSLNTSAERPGCPQAAVDGRYSSPARASAARLSRSPLTSWKSTSRPATPHCSAAA